MEGNAGLRERVRCIFGLCRIECDKVRSTSSSASKMARKTGYKGGQSSTSSNKSSPSSKRPPLTHFLCLPLVTNISKPQFEASIHQFQQLLSTKFLDGLPADDTPREFGQAPRAPWIPPKAIRPVGTIHFTLGVMSLDTDDRVQQAVEYLKSLDLKTMAAEEGSRRNGTSIN